ncbi:tRNA (adenosine(37)-N6)-threonylcarbamoyltransferase complex ATPase subunit type 1 TsaE [Antarctobacter jejuensis]|uniref:tRNA (adenosine(37)-N6)-threonylcarbamoyltransferase complex ATPase subunit type 1 TsaE n=1 Tax=Antarctobacter jejuensis TaxID=1439938 RepID=UPI003FD19EA7
MMPRHAEILLSTPDDTRAFAQRVGRVLRPGDVLLLHGQIGAGKTHFARSLIQSLQDGPEDVPSPTFTLVQVYDTRAGELWHADLYRLTGPDECVELGLTEAFESAICLVEWPDRLEDLTPANALNLSFAEAASEDARVLTLSWTDPRWDSLAEGVPA